ncbi:hypothetical protein [Azospirillum sp.]|uniref:hypothetical protein n=1 Tax=Azospirillum sp. TaxID=34012 RepID=UPI002D392D02|nr:hypothetical protein [Azospirillum sp.]HYF89592.1 hypothetical protein [Azospirillum sp.]
MNNPDIVRDLKEIAGVKDARNMTIEEGRRVFDLAGRGKLRESHVKFLADNFPHFVDLTKDSVQTIREISASASKSQIAGIDAIRSSIEANSKIIYRFLEMMDSEESKKTLSSAIVEISRCNTELGKCLEKMNDSNNDTWKGMAKAGLVGALAAFTIFKMIR